jgi:hypothetical protein
MAQATNRQRNSDSFSGSISNPLREICCRLGNYVANRRIDRQITIALQGSLDLECSREGVVEDVEVKGVRGSLPCFIITAGEVEQARQNGKFYLLVVTSALSSSPKLTKYSGAEFCRRFELSAIQYRAVLQS